MDYTRGRGKIVSNREIAPRHFEMVAEATFDLGDAAPGRFVMVRVSDNLSPILRRPFGIFRIDKEKNQFAILYRVVGEGTLLLSEMAAGVEIDVLGPLGTGFDLTLAGDAPLLVAGGVGVPPLFRLAEALVGQGRATCVIIGGRSKDDLLAVDEFKNLGVEVYLATEDGSEGRKGFVTGIMENKLSNASVVYSCGPTPMLKRVGEMAMEAGKPCELSLEAVMACGFGVCLGCVVKTCTVQNEDDHDYSRVCCEGPVFDAREIVWE